MGKQLCVADIAETVCATQSAVSHQLRILKQAHLVKFRRDGKNVIRSSFLLPASGSFFHLIRQRFLRRTFLFYPKM